MIKKNKFTNCFTERFLYNRRPCKWSSNFEEYMEKRAAELPDLYKGLDPLKAEGAKAATAWTGPRP